MKLKNVSKFHICGLNQEKLLNELCTNFTLFEIERVSKNDTFFECSYFDHKKIQKIIKSHRVKIESVSHSGVVPKVMQTLSSYGLMLAILVCGVLYFFQNQYVVQYQVLGTENLSKSEIVSFVKGEFSSKKSEIDTTQIENALIDHFARISFVSCIIKGQTLVLNIKEKLLPTQMYGEFPPLMAQKDGKVTKIELVSGTLRVKVGDIVRKGDVLVEPYTLDASGQLKKVEAKAEILAEVYFEGTAEHYETFVQTFRTGEKRVQSEVLLFGLSIYNFQQEVPFQRYETETEFQNLSKNLFLPFKMKKTMFYELAQETIVSKFEDVEDETVAKAKADAEQKMDSGGEVVDEFYTVRHIGGVTFVNYCIVMEESLCEQPS